MDKKKAVSNAISHLGPNLPPPAYRPIPQAQATQSARFWPPIYRPVQNTPQPKADPLIPFARREPSLLRPGLTLAKAPSPSPQGLAPPIFRPQAPPAPAKPMSSRPIASGQPPLPQAFVEANRRTEGVLQPMFSPWSGTKSYAKTKTLTNDDFPSLVPTSAPPLQQINLTAPTEFGKLATKKIESVAPLEEDLLTEVKTKISNWERHSHVGIKASLSNKEIAELTDWARSQKSKKGTNVVFNVLRGSGSGDWAAADQLKIIAIYSKPIGDKQPTFHVTLT